MKNYSPLRYPGGKIKLAPAIRDILQKNFPECSTYIEPFAGGAAVALSLLIEGVVERIIINDFDVAIYSFWDNVLNHTEDFVKEIAKIEVTIPQWRKQQHIYLHSTEDPSFELGLAAFFLNRTNYSGILTGGPIGGYEQKGNWTLECRFHKEALIQKILKIAEYRSQITIVKKDIFDFIAEDLPKRKTNKTFVYFDPPYYVKGYRLYKNFFTHEDHVNLKKQIRERVRCPWIVTYDNTQPILDIYRRERAQDIEVYYSAGTNTLGKEILFYSPMIDLSNVII